MIDEGKILSRHEMRNENSWITITIIIAILVFSTVIITLALTTSIFLTPSIFSILCVAIAAISLSGLLYLHLHENPEFTYFLYENGVRVFNHNNMEIYFIPFDKIKYIYKYNTGINPNGRIHAMAFRTSKSQPWNVIINNINNAYPLINTIIHQQIMRIGVINLNSLSHGETLEFDIIKKEEDWLKRMIYHGEIKTGIGRMNTHQMDTSSLSLSAHTLITINGIINIENIFRIETLQEAFYEKIRLLDTQGNIIFSIDYSDLINADLFIALIKHMIQNRIPAYNT
ncbi:Uncharacterised protein [Yersinia similis]|uniref:hypothetical protein n=1 Tax=Yersinia similis TaxID=367190 RepID=UPI0005E396D1|nr:hypothetical protein [Yersinia similis]CNE78355.1 Uncharacterised protein [Yersinia similis]